jgi:hypothetical protein
VNESDVAYLDTMDEVLELVLQFAEAARNADDDVALGVYLKMASRSLRCALEMYGEHLAQNRAEMKLGEPVNENLSSGTNPQ